MHHPLLLILAGVLLVSGWPTTDVRAQATSHTDSASFLTALPGPSQIIDFDSLVPGTSIPNSGTVEGITFEYDFGGVQAVVIDAFPTTSGSNSLGSDDGLVLQDGDDIQLSFGSLNAIGVFLVSADPLQDFDLALSAGGAKAELAAVDVEQTLVDGSSVYFLGIIDPVAPFDRANLTTPGSGEFLYNVDKLITGVPEPEGALGWVAAIYALVIAERRRHRASMGSRKNRHRFPNLRSAAFR